MKPRRVRAGDIKHELRAIDAAMLLLYLKQFEHTFKEHNDAVNPIRELERRLGYTAWVDVPVLESALYCANLLNEEGKFFHPLGLTFDEFLNRVSGGKEFSRIYNYFGEKKGA